MSLKGKLSVLSISHRKISKRVSIHGLWLTITDPSTNGRKNGGNNTDNFAESMVGQVHDTGTRAFQVPGVFRIPVCGDPEVQSTHNVPCEAVKKKSNQIRRTVPQFCLTGD